MKPRPFGAIVAAAAALVLVGALSTCAGQRGQVTAMAPSGPATAAPETTGPAIAAPAITAHATMTPEIAHAASLAPTHTAAPAAFTAIPADSTTAANPARGIAVPGGDALPASSVPLASAASAVAVTPDGRLVVAANPDSGSISIVDATTLAVISEVTVGAAPRTIAVTPDSSFALVANHGDGTLSAVDLRDYAEEARWDIGPMPYGVVTDGRKAWVAAFALGEVAVVDLATGTVAGRVTVEPFPAGAALSPDGATLAVTHFFSGRVTIIDTAQESIVAVVDTGLDTNLSQYVAFDSKGANLYLPQTRSNASNRALLFDTTVFPVVNVVSIEGRAVMASKRITIDTADRPVNMPFSLAITNAGDTLVVANAGSDNVSVFDLATGRGRVNISVGSNPRGIALDHEESRAFVNNTLDGTLSVIDLESGIVRATTRITTIPLTDNVLDGKRIFNSSEAPDLSTDYWISCAVCHFDGMHDGRTWAGFPDGPRNTPSLLGVAQTGPFHWSGDLDELHDVELTIRKIQAGKGLAPDEARDSLGPPYAGLSKDLDALAAYLGTLTPIHSPMRAEPAEIARGQVVFQNAGCAACHQPPLFTDRSGHDVGTGDPALERNSHGRGTTFDTPSLRGLWLSAPYFHDGSAATLEDVLRIGPVHGAAALTAAERQDLIAYLLSL